jgi:hypothetical protein
MTLLSTIQDVADQIGLPRPSAVISSTDQSVRTLLALANLEGRILLKRHQWSALQKEATFVTLAAQDQGAISTIAPGFDYILNETEWNRSQFRPLGGPLSPQDWQQLKAFSATGPYPMFRIWQGHLYLQPAPAAGLTGAFEYMSLNWCQSSGGTGQSGWAADTDTGVLDETLMGMGVKWRFLQSKGLGYDEAFRDYEMMVNQAIARDGGRKRFNLAAEAGDYSPLNSVIAPDGNWMV